MKTRPILFSGPMVRALLDNRKTQTRRVVKRLADPARGMLDNPAVIKTPLANGWLGLDVPGVMATAIYCPYGQPGDRLWVKESGWQPPAITSKLLRDGADTWPEYFYDADMVPSDHDWCRDHGWKRRPSIFMPRRASRITLEIVNVRVERVRDISEEDAQAEGVRKFATPAVREGFAWEIPGTQCGGPTAKATFLDLFFYINERAPKESNPWVWVIEFKKI